MTAMWCTVATGSLAMDAIADWSERDEVGPLAGYRRA